MRQDKKIGKEKRKNAEGIESICVFEGDERERERIGGVKKAGQGREGRGGGGTN